MNFQSAPEPHSGQSRRSFLAQTAALAGASAILAHRPAAAAQPATIPKAKARPALKDGDTIRMAVIGPGGMGTGHVHAFCNFSAKGEANVEVVALADVCDLRVLDGKKKAEETYKSQVQTYRDYREMLKRDDIHAILIASPEHWHAQHAIDAIVAGKDVYLEKPMTFYADEAVRLMNVVNANPDAVFQVGTQKMQLKKYQEAKKLIEAGAIGVPTFSQTSYCRNSKDGEWLYYGIDPSWDPKSNIDWETWCGKGPHIAWSPEVYARWRRYKSWSSGIIGDLLVHEITPLMMALESCGWPTRIVACGSHLVDKKMENHDQVNITIEFESGHIMTVAGSTCNDSGVETMIRGHRANLYLADRHCTLRPQRLFTDEVDEKKVQCPDIGNDQDVHRLNWLECIRTREKPLAGVELGTKVMVVVDLATRSLWEGGTMYWDKNTMTMRKG